MAGLHHVNNTYVWSGNGADETIWDWLEDVNNENGGVGYASHNDWRIPNVRELLTLLDWSRESPAIAPAFNNGCVAGCANTVCSCTLIPHFRFER